jgi:ABC-type polysaccharide/polyol phosphate transport system ATPase subunit
MADAAFTERADARLREFMSSAGIVVLASHGDDLLLSHCTSGVWLDRGAVRARGSVALVLNEYHASHRAPIASATSAHSTR